MSDSVLEAIVRGLPFPRLYVAPTPESEAESEMARREHLAAESAFDAAAQAARQEHWTFEEIMAREG